MAGVSEFDAFISYSHALDGKFAPALQAGIEGFGKPWYLMRSVRLFRDETNLSAAPNLWSRIEEALNRSRWLILMASFESARSRWVKQEVAHWLRHKEASRILIVVTDGMLVWDDSKSDFDWAHSNAIPSELEGAFEREPLYADMRWARDASTQLTMKDPRFAQIILSLSSTIQGRSMDELGGEAVRNHKVARRLAVASVSTISALAVGAMILAYLAVGAAQRADERNSEAQRRESLRLAFAAEAEIDSGNATDGASLALAALPTRFDINRAWLPWLPKPQADRPTVAEATGALVKAISTQREALFLAPNDGEQIDQFTACRFLQGGSQIFTLSKSGHYRVYNTSSGAIVIDAPVPVRGPKFIAVSDGGDRAIVAGENGDIVYWSPKGLFPSVMLPIKSPEREGFQDRLFAAMDLAEPRLLLIPPTGNGQLFAVPAGTVIASLPYEPIGIGAIEVANTSSGTRFIFNALGKIVFLDAATGLSDDAAPSVAADADALSVSFDGQNLLSRGEIGGRAGAFVWRKNADSPGFALARNIELQPRDKIIISPDGRFLAKITPNGVVQVGDTHSNLKMKLLSTGIPIFDAVFSRGGDMLLARLDNGAAVLWRTGPTGWFDGLTVAPGPGYSGVLTNDGQTIIASVLTVSLAERALKGAIAAWDQATGKESRRIEVSDWIRRLVLSADNKFLLCVFVNGSIEVWDVKDWVRRAFIRPTEDSGQDYFVDAAFSPDGKYFWAAKAGGIITQNDSQDGREIGRINLGSEDLTGFAMSPGGQTMVAVFKSAPGILWRNGELSSSRILLRSLSPAQHVAFSSDGKIIATAGGLGNVTIFNSSDGRMTDTRFANGELLSSITFDHTGKRLASVSENGTIFIWGLANRRDDAEIKYGKVRIYSIAFSPDDHWVLTTAHDGLVRMWQIGADLPDLISLARTRRPHCLSEEQARIYVLSGAAENDVSRSGPCTQVINKFESELN